MWPRVPAAHTRSADLDFIYATTLACRLIGRLGGALLGDRDRVVKRHGSREPPVMSSSHVTFVEEGEEIEKIHEESSARYSQTRLGGEKSRTRCDKDEGPFRRKDMYVLISN